MSSSQPHIAQITLQGEGTWPDLHAEHVSPQLNVFYGQSKSGKSTIAQLLGHLLYGKAESDWRRQFGQTVHPAEGSMRFESPEGSFVLRRHFDAQRNSRLTIASGQGDAIDGETIRNLLCDLSPEMAATLYHVDFAETPRVETLLNERFAREFTRSASHNEPASSRRSYTCCAPASRTNFEQIDKRRIDELVRRRDHIAEELQQQLSVRRRESELLEQELETLDATLVSKRRQLPKLQTELHRLDNQLAELETQLRYHSLDHYARTHRSDEGPELDTHQLSGLDHEIAHCRKSIADLQQREHALRTELAESSADGTADSVTCLQDGRATLGVLEQLMNDLDAEIAQLARAGEAGHCLGRDSHAAHAKMSPVAALLRQHLYTLCGQLTEQERIVHRQQLLVELRQLARVHTELADRLELLLSRREALVQRSRLGARPLQLLAQPPVAGYCRCDHHAHFVSSIDGLSYERVGLGRKEKELRAEHQSLDRQRRELIDKIDGLADEIESLAERWETVQRQRAGLISGATLEQQREELGRLEAVIRQSLSEKNNGIRESHSHWLASDVLAQLTDGHLVQIRLDRHQSLATIVDRQGRTRSLDSLTPAEHDQLYLAITLSLVHSFAQRNVKLPLILDEPFLQLDAHQAATLAGVLHQFGREGHQVLVFTEDRQVQRRLATLQTNMFDLDLLRSSKPVPVSTPLAQPTTRTKTSTRIVRETFDTSTSPALRLATIDTDAESDEVFLLTENASFDQFPVLGADTVQAFARINIHTVLDLLSGDSTEIAQRLGRDGITTDTVRLWQIHTGLMCHVPDLTINDAQVLAACGISSPEDLFDADLDALLLSIDGFLSSDRGRRFRSSQSRFDCSRLTSWQRGARRNRERWQDRSQEYSGWRRRRRPQGQRDSRQVREPRREDSRAREVRPSQQASRTSRQEVRKRRELRFYLSRNEDVEAAPSIGPKTAQRLARVGIRTVADLLQADPESVAAELDVNHINADTVTEWQHQARLVCQIPGLRGYGAQLLVACGLTRPEQIAGAGRDALVAQILEFCETKEGQRILRSSDPPKRSKIAEWVQLAAQSRPLDAA